MIVDTSALVAIALAEPESADCVQALRDSARSRMSAASYLECGIVLDHRSGASVSGVLDELVSGFAITISDVTAEQARIARQAYRDFGKGSGHPAQLNFGDCFSYALAVDTSEPLLYKGDDFAHTGIRSAVPNP